MHTPNSLWDDSRGRHRTMVRLSADLILRSPQFFNAVHEREIDLRVAHHGTMSKANVVHLYGQVEEQKQQRRAWTAQQHANLDGKARVPGSLFAALPPMLLQHIQVMPTASASLLGTKITLPGTVVGPVRTRSDSAGEADEPAPQAKDAARKALEQAFQGKMNIFKKWDMEIKNREMAGGGGSGGGSAWGGSGGGGGGDGDEEGRGSSGHDEPWDWEEAGEVFMATSALILLYMLITLGPEDTYKLIVFWAKFVLRGFKLRRLPRGYTLNSASNLPPPPLSNNDTMTTREDGVEIDDDGRYLENVKDEKVIMMQQMRLREQRRRHMDEERDDDF